MIPTYTLRDFTYLKSMKSLCAEASTLGLTVGRMPTRFQIKSETTGRVITLLPITPDHPKFDEDGWDGEQQVYAPTEYLEKLETVTIFND